MRSSPYINHVTLATGHTRRSYRAEVADDTLKMGFQAQWNGKSS